MTFSPPFMTTFFGPEAAPATWTALQHLLVPLLPHNCRVLARRCGAGRLAPRPPQRGFAAAAAAHAPAMLACALQPAPEADFVEQDVRRLSLHGRFHAAVSAYNSLARLPADDDMLRVF